jgi:hypothetical protein
MKFLNFFSTFVGYFTLLDPEPDPDSEYGSGSNTDPDPKPCKKHVTVVGGREPGAEKQQEAQPQGLQGQEGGGGAGQAQHRERGQ